MGFGYSPTNITSVKGAIGERICVEHWIKEGKLVYGLFNGLLCHSCRSPVYADDRRHFFDFLVMDANPGNYSEVPFASIKPTEVKTKKSLHGRVSLSEKNLFEYWQFINSLYRRSEGVWEEIPFTIVFVDDNTGFTYQQSLKKLLDPCTINEEKFPQRVECTKVRNGKEYSNHYLWFSLLQMEKSFKLSNQQREELHEVSSNQSS